MRNEKEKEGRQKERRKSEGREKEMGNRID